MGSVTSAGGYMCWYMCGMGHWGILRDSWTSADGYMCMCMCGMRH